MIWLGIDPGVSGGIGVIQTNDLLPSGLIGDAYKMPATDADLFELLVSVCSTEDSTAGTTMSRREVFCYLEKAQAYPGGIKYARCPSCSATMKTRQAQGVVSTGKFLQQYGTLRGVLTAIPIPFEIVTANTWQKALGCQTKGDKNISKAKAQRLFPDIKVTHATADAMLLAEYCRIVRTSWQFRKPTNERKTHEL